MKNRMLAVLSAAAAAAFLCLPACAEIAEEPLVNPADETDVWGKKITGLGDNGDETALVFTKTGETMSWTLPDGVKSVRYLVVGGGGSGGGSYASNVKGGGAGGAGGLLTDTVPFDSANVLSIVVGAGGVANGNTAYPGADSCLSFGQTALTAKGGGKGGANGSAGGSGGSGGGGSGTKSGGSGMADQGYAGGVSSASRGGGGGGAGGAGGAGADGGTAGPGVVSNITGSDYEYAKGGVGGVSSKTGASATTYGGGGNGGAYQNKAGGNGCHGVVIVRYSTAMQKNPVVLPEVKGVTYNGELQKADATSFDFEKYDVVNDGGTDAGVYPVTFSLKNPTEDEWVDDHSSTNKTLYFVISKAENGWTTEPSLSKTTWEYLDPAATVTFGAAMTGEAATVLYDGVTDVMPESVGSHTAVFTVAESTNYNGLSKTIPYTIKPRTNKWVEEPSVTPASWVFDEQAGAVSFGEAESGVGVVVTYDVGLTEMPTEIGEHTAIFTVAANENYTSLSKTIPFEITKKVNGWTSAPVVEPTRYTPDALPPFTPPTATYGEVVCYFDGDPENTEVPTSMGKHTVTYAVAEGDDYQAFEQTIELTVLDRATLGVAQVVITGYDGSETLTNFPALVRFSAANVEGLNADLLSEDGSDVRVYGEDGNELAFEIESWDRTGESLIWVKIPELVPTSEKTTSVFVKWGATEARTTDSKDVWTEYLAVWHMNDTTTLGEAAGNGSELTGATCTLEDGVVGKAIKHSTDMKMTDFVHGEGGIGENYTISCWYKLPSGGDGAVLNKGSWVDNGRWYTQYKSSTTSMGLIRDKGVRASLTTRDCKTAWNYTAVINNDGAMSAVVNEASSLTSFGKLALADDYAFTVSRSNALVDELRIRKCASSAVWTRAECRAQSGEFVACALVQNPEFEDVIVVPTETPPVVDSERNLTIGYRVSSTGGSKVTVKALYAMEGADTTNETVIGSASDIQTEDAFGTIADLRPATNYLVAVYGVNASGVASEPTAWQQVAVPGPVVIDDLAFSQTKDKATVSGVITGLGAKAAKLRYAFGADEFAEIDLVLDDDGAFSVALDRTSATDTLKYQVVADNTLSTTTWGDFAWNAETKVKTSTDSTAVTYTWKGGASGEWADPANWEASIPSSYGLPNNETYATAKFVSDAEVDLDGRSYSVNKLASAGSPKVKIANGTLAHKDTDYTMGGTLLVENATFNVSRWSSHGNGHSIVLEGNSTMDGYRPWNSTGGTLLIRNGESTINYFLGYCNVGEGKDNNWFEVSNAVLTVTGAATSNGRPLVIRNGAEHQGRVCYTDANGSDLSYYRYDFEVPANGLRQPSIDIKKMTNFRSLIANKTSGAPRITVDVRNFERGKKVPLVRYGTTLMAELPTPELTTVPAEAKTERNARLYWENNTLYYKQDGKFGFLIQVK